MWAASAGNELPKANAAIDLNDPKTKARRLGENTLTVPPSVVEKWQAALLEAHGPACVFKRKERLGAKINGQHIYQFVLAGAQRLSMHPATPATPQWQEI